MAKLTNTQLREKMEKAISEMEKVLDDDDATPNQKTYAGSNLASLIKQYKEHFGVEVDGSGERKSKLKKASGFSGE